jgi:hypothetical protein
MSRVLRVRIRFYRWGGGACIGEGRDTSFPSCPALFVKISGILQDAANPSPDTSLRFNSENNQRALEPGIDPSRIRRGRMRHLTILELWALHDARIWEIVHPHVPILRGPGDRGEEVGLNPQPLPPKLLGALAAREFLQLAWQAEMLGINPERVADAGDILCPLPPKLPKFPWPWPSPPPDPDPGWYRDFHVGVIDELTASPILSERTAIAKTVASKLKESSGFIPKSIG